MELKRVRALLIYEYLKAYSDEEHPVSSHTLIDMLEKKGIIAARKTIYNDIRELRAIGCDIMMECGMGYFIAARRFELPEVMLLIDAVKSAGFITPKKTASLVEKLKSLVSAQQAEELTGQVYMDAPSSKCDNEEIYIVINQLHSAVIREKKVRFTYRRRSIDVYNMKRHTQKVFVVSPYALIWKDDHYYLICNNEKYDDLMNLRVDRMKGLEILSEAARPVSEVSRYINGFDAGDYSEKMFNMFSGEECEVTLRCSLKLQEEMLDRFGASIPLTAADPSHFETKVTATLSDGFVSWVMQYGADIEIVSPPELIERLRAKTRAILDKYEKRIS